jgi:hypothetical protein
MAYGVSQWRAALAPRHPPRQGGACGAASSGTGVPWSTVRGAAPGPRHPPRQGPRPWTPKPTAFPTGTPGGPCQPPRSECCRLRCTAAARHSAFHIPHSAFRMCSATGVQPGTHSPHLRARHAAMACGERRASALGGLGGKATQAGGAGGGSPAATGSHCPGAREARRRRTATQVGGAGGGSPAARWRGLGGGATRAGAAAPHCGRRHPEGVGAAAPPEGPQ